MPEIAAPAFDPYVQPAFLSFLLFLASTRAVILRQIAPVGISRRCRVAMVAVSDIDDGEMSNNI